MNYRHLFPVLRLLLPFLAGIAAAIGFPGSGTIPVAVLATLALMTAASAFFIQKRSKFGNEWIFGILINITLCAYGYDLLRRHTSILQADHFSKISHPEVLIARLDEPLQSKEHSYKTILKVLACKSGNSVLPCQGKILAYFAKDSSVALPEPGSVVMMASVPQEIAPPLNPGAFNYKRYMASSNVYHQVYIPSAEWRTLQTAHRFNIRFAAQKVRDYFVKTLSNSGLKGREFAVATALILGQNDMLDSETLQEYSGSGVTHILSVSGLHVGVIYLVINFLLGFLNKKKWQQYLKTSIILLSIGAYALLTGLSPAVNRAALMFSFITIGNMTNRYVHIINSLSVSAFILLLVNPWVLTNIGFQLSYIAIIGIVSLNKPIESLWSPKNRILDYLWQMISVSFAAQIATVPLTLFYFHQFPQYFIPANLVAIPLSSVVIYSGLLVLATSFLPIVSHFFGIITNFLLFCMNSAIAFIEHLPHAVLSITNVYFKEMLLLYFLITAIFLLFKLKKKYYLFASASVLILLSISFSVTLIQRQKQNKLVAFQMNKLDAIGLIDGRHEVLLADRVVLADPKAENYQLKPARNYYGIRHLHVATFENPAYVPDKLQSHFTELGKFYLYGNRRIAVIDSVPPYTGGSIIPVKIDFLFLHKTQRIKISDLLRYYSPQLVIIGNSVSVYRTEKWLSECRLLRISAHSLRTGGSYTADL